jgi:hypothetical protein
VGAASYYPTSGDKDVFTETSRAFANRDLASLLAIGRGQKAEYLVVPWRVPGAAFSDGEFSVIAVRPAKP